MNDSLTVTEAKREEELLEVATGLSFVRATRVDELFKELSSSGELHDEIDLRFSGHHFVDLEDVWVVVEATHGFDLSDDPWFHMSLTGFLLVDDFDGNEFAGLDGTSYMDFGKASAA